MSCKTIQTSSFSLPHFHSDAFDCVLGVVWPNKVKSSTFMVFGCLHEDSASPAIEKERSATKEKAEKVAFGKTAESTISLGPGPQATRNVEDSHLFVA